ncbi:MAG: DnaD domain protein [Vallitaleaceae bacterium]|nr:DnaD domain protein [Vallitaleaceae bacterium]
MTGSSIKLRPQNYIPYTLIPNFFIDSHMAKANGEFIKVYLVLLRFMAIHNLDFQLSQIADLLFMTESDVLRALQYFQSERLLTMTFQGNVLKEIHLNDFNNGYDPYVTPPMPSSVLKSDTAPNYDLETPEDSTEAKLPHLHVVAEKAEYTTSDIISFTERDDFNQLLYIVQKYLGKTLSTGDVKTIISFNDWLGLPLDVIEILIEYCVDNDHRNMRYIEKVAIDWADHEINTVEKARTRTEVYNKSYFTIMKAYGIIDRSPTPKQIKLMDKWMNELNMSIELIVEACSRTIAQINKAEMKYTDTILESWTKAGVKKISDLDVLDANKPQIAPHKTTAPIKNTSFNNFSQRQYDYEELERKALEMRLNESKGKRYSS